MTYKATKIRARPWSEVAQQFARIESPAPAHVALGGLCEHVERATYRDLVFCATSMHTLLVGQHAELEWLNQMLKIEPKADNLIAFAFHERDYSAPVESSCAPQELVATFERFLQRTKWISDDLTESYGSSRGEAPR